MREVYKEAIGVIRETGRESISHKDFERIVNVFNRLMDTGFFVEHPGKIADYVTRFFGDETMAREIQIIYETLEVVHKGGTSVSEKVIQEILAFN